MDVLGQPIRSWLAAHASSFGRSRAAASGSPAQSAEKRLDSFGRQIV